jgi:glycosyltransferase involved in cell wall biosynthesis
MSSADPSLLLLVPAYNEEKRIEPVLREYAAYFQQSYQGKFQLVVVLNGCTDNTLAVVRRVAAEFPTVSALEFREPIGKGGALIEGLKLAPLADVIGYVDADGASPPRAFHDLVKLLDGADCAIGSRWLPGARLHQAQTRLRRFTSRCFHLVVEICFRMHIKDTQCPCKAMRRAAVEKIHSTLRIADLAFDVNLLVSLKRAGFTVLEVFLSVVRLKLIYSGIARYLQPLSPLSGWAYRKLRAPHRPGPPAGDQSKSLEEKDPKK